MQRHQSQQHGCSPTRTTNGSSAITTSSYDFSTPGQEIQPQPKIVCPSTPSIPLTASTNGFASQDSATQPTLSTTVPTQKRQPQTRMHRGKQPKWQDLEKMASTIIVATVNLPDASINGSKQKQTVWHAQLKGEFDRLLETLIPEHPELNNREKMDIWKTRSGRSISEQGQKDLAICRTLKGCLRIVDAHRFTGNPTASDKMRCATGLYNDAIKVSLHFYDVFRNPNYVIGKAFPYPKTFELLDTATMELDPTLSLPQDKAPTVPVLEGQVDEAHHGAHVVDDIQYSGGRSNEICRTDADITEPHTRPIGVKAAKAAKKAKKETANEDGVLQSALNSWTKGFADASSASIEAANSWAMMNREQSDRDYELRKEADELEAVKVLFNVQDEDSQKYRKALKRKRLRKLLEEENIEKSDQSSPTDD